MNTKSIVEMYGALSVKEGRLTAQNGETVQLKGISSHGLSWYPEYVNYETMKFMRDQWGIQLFRLAMYTAEEDGYCVGSQENKNKLKQVVKDGVQAATQLGLYVIIDWHILSDSNPLQYQAEAMDFFDEMAQLYKDHTNVLYEICNEPNVDAEWKDIREYAQNVIPVIRKHDQKAVILVGTPTWSQDVDAAQADPVQGDENLMYVLHFYADTHRDELRNKLQIAVMQGLPVFVSEFGICDASGNGAINEEQGDIWLNLLDENKISYAIWNLSNRDESSALIRPDCQKLTDFTEADLSDEAHWYLKKLAGKDK